MASIPGRDVGGQIIPDYDTASCEKCGVWVDPERDKDGCANCRTITQRADERARASQEIAFAIRRISEQRIGTIAFNKSADRLADALDHYIARSTQDWCR